MGFINKYKNCCPDLYSQFENSKKMKQRGFYNIKTLDNSCVIKLILYNFILFNQITILSYNEFIDFVNIKSVIELLKILKLIYLEINYIKEVNQKITKESTNKPATKSFNLLKKSGIRDYKINLNTKQLAKVFLLFFNKNQT